MKKLTIALLLIALLISLSSGRQIGFENKCCKDVDLAIHIKSPDGTWRNYGWYSYAPCEGISYLEHDGLRLNTNNKKIYWYAETSDGKYKWWGNDLTVNFKGRTLNMREYTLDKKDGEYWFFTSCPEIKPCGNQCDPTTWVVDTWNGKEATTCHCGYLSGGGG